MLIFSGGISIWLNRFSIMQQLQLSMLSLAMGQYSSRLKVTTFLKDTSPLLYISMSSLQTFSGVEPVAKPSTKGSLLLRLLAFMASRISSATRLEPSELVWKNLGGIFSMSEKRGKLARQLRVSFRGTFGSTFSIFNINRLTTFGHIYYTMKVVHIVKYGRFPELREVPIPALQSEQILVKMKYAPVNPSDIFFYMGKYGIQKKGFPVAGFEGSGVIQKASDARLIGRKVSVFSNHSNGTHASHIISQKDDLLLWPDSADLQQISMAFVNPVSCVGLCSIVQQHQPENVVISAAASQIGRMLIAKLRDRHPSIKIYGLNRSENKKQLLMALGVADVIMIEDPPAEKLRNLSGKTVFLDCVGGTFAGKTFNTLGQNSIMVSYGRQSGEDLGAVDLGGLYYKNKVIRGFWLNNWMKQLNQTQRLQAKQKVQDSFEKYYTSVVRKTFPIQSFMDAYRLSIKDKSEGKILLEL